MKLMRTPLFIFVNPMLVRVTLFHREPGYLGSHARRRFG